MSNRRYNRQTRTGSKAGVPDGVEIPDTAGTSTRMILWTCILLAASILLLYVRVAGHGFINYDDDDYVFENAHVSSGLAFENVLWALKSGHAANWHPLTWISHMLDCQLFGLKPGPQHVVSVLFHCANSVLLFLLLFRLTGFQWRSAVVAALFAFHPTHVESVAWIAERKDVLSTFFWLLTLIAYGRYTKRPSWFRYGVITACLALGLMSKPMVVTLPCVLLLVDYWPLNRLRSLQDFGRLFVEKIPLFALSAAGCVITFVVQRNSGTVVSVESVELSTRISNSMITYLFYLWKTLWPSPLFVPYWYDLRIGSLAFASVVIILLAFTGLAVRFGTRARYLPVGWFLFLGTLVPVIGLVQVGAATAADRYTYVPTIGIFMVVVWGIADLFQRWRTPNWVAATISAAVMGICALLTFRQIGYWRNGEALFQHALQADPPNLLAASMLGWTYATDLDPKLRNGARAVELALFVASIMNRSDAISLRVLAAGYAEMGKFPLAVQTAEEALRLQHARIQPLLMAKLQTELNLYRSGRAIRQK
jgi:protein O-mannosyl-transferase